MSKLKQVAVIGAGPAGLCTLRHLLYSNANPNVVIKPVVFEQNNSVGGTWVYQDVDKDNKQDVFSSIYTNLKTNLPKQVMNFPDVPFPAHVPSYLHHTHVQEYLNDYADHFDLKSHIRFNTSVVSVAPVFDEKKDKLDVWNVKSRSILTGEIVEEKYDAVVVCNGQYSVPSYVTVKGIENFSGEILHSHYYRRPSDFANKNVLLLGCGPSGQDIMVELSKFCKTVYMSHRGKRMSSALAENIKDCPNISHVTEDGKFVFEDSTSVVVDTFMQCTGYKLNFPFLSDECGIAIEENTIKGLYMHLFSIQNPSLIFVGLNWKVAPLPMFHQQCQYIVKVLSEMMDLPTKEEMFKDTAMERKSRHDAGEAKKYFHRMGDLQWSYSNKIAAIAGNEENPLIIEKLYKYISEQRSKNLWTYKSKEFRAINDSVFEDISGG